MTFKHLKTRGIQLLFSFIGLVALTLNVSASERKIEAEVLLKSTKDWRGVTLPTYSEGQPEVTVAKITIPAGMALPLHEHPYTDAREVEAPCLRVS